jgi:hypothetical protein
MLAKKFLFTCYLQRLCPWMSGSKADGFTTSSRPPKAAGTGLRHAEAVLNIVRDLYYHFKIKSAYIPSPVAWPAVLRRGRVLRMKLQKLSDDKEISSGGTVVFQKTDEVFWRRSRRPSAK